MARSNNTFEKMRREQLKKQKAADKRARRLKKKENADEPADVSSDAPVSTGDESQTARNESLSD